MQQRSTVLLIEDDEDVRVPNARALEEAGYRVVQAGGWENALSIARERAEKIAVVVTDLIMPDAGGIDTFSRLVKSQGPIPVIVVSGYPRMMKFLDGVLDGVVEWLHKPVEATAVVQAVERAIDTA